MDILTTDISKLSFKAVKEKVDEINVKELLNSSTLIEIINILKSDKRKNINRWTTKTNDSFYIDDCIV